MSLEGVLGWFDAVPRRHWWLTCIVITVALFFLIRPFFRRAWRDLLGSDWAWGWIISAVLVSGRWPTWFVPRALNQDESQLVAGALTLRHDPVFWRSVDGGTAGPLDFFALLPAGYFWGTDDVMTARVTACLLLGIALLFTHQVLALTTGRHVARIATFGAVLLEALNLDGDLLHYSTELVPIALLAGACWLAARRFAGGASPIVSSIAGGLVLGSVPLAKLQAGPIALLLGVGWLMAEISLVPQPRKQRLAIIFALCGGAMMPTGSCAVMLSLTGQWQNALIPYFLNNLHYVGRADNSTAVVIKLLWKQAMTPDALMGLWALGSSLWIAITLASTTRASRAQQIMVVGSFAFLLIAALATLAPKRNFFHYCQLLVVPGTLCFGACTACLLQQLKDRPADWAKAALCIALMLGVGPLLAQRAANPHPYIGHLVQFHKNPCSDLARTLRHYAHSGEAIGVWGWKNECYAETGLRQAVRNANSEAEILPGPYQAYFRARYVSDLRANRPPVFIDVAQPSFLLPVTTSIRHYQIFPELKDFISLNYTLVDRPQQNFLYVRNDRLGPVP